MNLSTHRPFQALLDQNGAETLFLYRDGTVIEKQTEYRPTQTLSIKPEFLDVSPSLAKKFRRIILLSNSLLPNPTDESVKAQEEINRHIIAEVANAGGRIDAFYIDCQPDLVDNTYVSGPMLPLKAKRDFPSINFATSVLVGTSQECHNLAFNCGMKFFNPDSADNESTLAADEALLLQEMETLRGCTLNYVDTIQKLKNSAVRMNGVRLASRCVCHAMACNRRVLMVLDTDSGFDPLEFKSTLDEVVRGSKHSGVITVISAHSDESMSEQVARQCHPGDLVIGVAAMASSPRVIEALNEGRRLGAVTVSLTGAKPGDMDSADVVVKVPSVLIAHIQGCFKVIIAMIHVMVWKEQQEGRIF